MRIVCEFREEERLETVFRESERFTADFGEISIVADPSRIPQYSGETEITPTRQEQILSTSGKMVNSSIVVKPIPNNYGLITYDGHKITVS